MLEQAARLLYKEWFIHLRFPGHEHVKIKDGVPEGWERKPLGEIADMKMGREVDLLNEDGYGLPFSPRRSNVLDQRHCRNSSIGLLVTWPNRSSLDAKVILAAFTGRRKNAFTIDTVYWASRAIRTEIFAFLYYALRNVPFISTDVAVPGLNRDFEGSHSRLILTPSSGRTSVFSRTWSALFVSKSTSYVGKMPSSKEPVT